jgi:hypothetical protein
MWKFVGNRSLTWRYLDEAENFLSASSFNLYYRYMDKLCGRKGAATWISFIQVLNG